MKEVGLVSTMAYNNYGVHTEPLMIGFTAITITNVSGEYRFQPEKFDCVVTKPDNPITLDGKLWHKISEEDIDNITDKSIKILSKKEFLLGASQVFHTCHNYNIYVIGWNVSREPLEILENMGCKYLNHNWLHVPTVTTIDIKDLAAKCLDITKIGAITMDTIDAYFMLNEGIPLQTVYQRLLDNRNKFNGLQYCRTLNIRLISQLQKFMDLKGFKTFSEVVEFINRPEMLSEMPFGKYKGVKMAELIKVDREYIEWLKLSGTANKSVSLAYTVDELLKQ